MKRTGFVPLPQGRKTKQMLATLFYTSFYLNANSNELFVIRFYYSTNRMLQAVLHCWLLSHHTVSHVKKLGHACCGKKGNTIVNEDDLAKKNKRTMKLAPVPIHPHHC